MTVARTAAGTPMPKTSTTGSRYAKAGDDLHGVEYRAQRAEDPVGQTGGQAEQCSEDHGGQDGDDHQREGLHRGHPHAEQCAEDERGDGGECEPDAG